MTSAQRWRERQSTMHPAAEPFDPSRYGVEIIPDSMECQ